MLRRMAAAMLTAATNKAAIELGAFGSPRVCSIQWPFQKGLFGRCTALGKSSGGAKETRSTKQIRRVLEG
jgi:hypothetical protein